MQRPFARTCLSAAVLFVLVASARAADERPVRSPWNVSLSAGWLELENDEALRGDFTYGVQLGYDLSERWTLEGSLDVAPDMDETLVKDVPSGKHVSRLRLATGEAVRDSTSSRASLDALFHLAPASRLDPYIGLGAGGLWYEEDFGAQAQGTLRARGGCAWNLNDTWALRGDVCVFMPMPDTEANLLVGIGIMRHFGTAPAPAALVPPATDTDFDGLTDWEEVNTYSTNPRKRDSDAGGVADGHEVIEDATDPLAKADDLQLYELQINFEPESFEIGAEYFSELDAIAGILRDSPAATARIEGHVDQKPGMADAQRLTKRRAQAIERYFRKQHDIAGRRLTAAGYGFSRPKAANDPVKGNPANERMEIYIRGAAEPGAPAPAPAPAPKPAAVPAPAPAVAPAPEPAPPPAPAPEDK